MHFVFNSHVVSFSFFKSVNFAVAHVVELVCKCLLSSSNFSPSFSIIFAPVQVQRKRKRDGHALIDIEGVQLSVDIEGKEDFVAALAEGLYAGHSVVLCVVELGDFEAIFEEDVFLHLDDRLSGVLRS